MKLWITALFLAGCTSLHAQGPTPAPSTGHVAFTVKRGDCASPEELDLDHWKDVKSKWRSDGALEVTLWDSETQEYSVIDDSASLDASAPDTLRLFYRVKQTPLPPDSPVVFCEDWVKLIFVIHGCARALPSDGGDYAASSGSRHRGLGRECPLLADSGHSEINRDPAVPKEKAARV